MKINKNCQNFQKEAEFLHEVKKREKGDKLNIGLLIKRTTFGNTNTYPLPKMKEKL